jgi:XTP/dITP diphosphohydrolase
MSTLYLASGNAHKIRELAEMARQAKASFTLKSANEIGGMPEVVEDAGTLEGNARKKALALVPQLPADAWALADDSGLIVDALDGAPGVYSARYAGENATDAENNAKLLEVMKGVPEAERTARFACVLVARNAAGDEHVFTGFSEGVITFAPAGNKGFGYGPVFKPEGFDQTYAELGDAVKLKLSHRARAFSALLAAEGVF